MKLGIYGGSFDPVHIGHLLVAQAAIEELGLDRLFFIPAAQSPFKPENKPAPAAVRLRLLRLALAGKTNCEIDEQEIQRGGVSYTVDTLRDYKKKFPAAKLFYLIGADNAAKLNEWREPAELAKLAEFAAVLRPGGAPAVFPPPFRGRILQGFPFGVSSSEIRARFKTNLPIENLVPTAVAEAIRAASLRLEIYPCPSALVCGLIPAVFMDSKKLALLCRELADNKKAENIAILDVQKVSSVTDYFVIATGTSQPHLRAIVEEITSRLRDEHDLRPVRTDGPLTGAWMVLDFFDVIVHVMHTEARARYDLEGLWGDAAKVKPKKRPAPKTKIKTSRAPNLKSRSARE